MISRPQPNEYAYFYKNYVDKVPEGNVIQYLEEQADQFVELIKGLSKEKLSYAYGPDKWTVKEVLGHIIDTERIMSSRMLRFARQDKTSMPGFEQNDYVDRARFNDRDIASLTNEFYHLRKSNLAFIQSLSDQESEYTGQANEAVFSVRALIFILAGHLRHHWDILNEKYL